MGSKIEYVESSQIHATSYIRNSKAIGVLWGIFTICFAIIVVVAFVTPEWIGDGAESQAPARFGLWKYCVFHTEATVTGGVVPETECYGQLSDFSSILNPAIRAATAFVGLAVILTLLCVCSMLLFFFFQSTTVFHICGWMQVVSAICLVVGVLAYPAGWDAPVIKQTCGVSAGRYQLGDCSPRWALLLAVVGCLDAAILAALAFILATRHVKLQAEPPFPANGSLYKGEINGAYVTDGASLAGSRKSLNLQPVLLLPQPEVDRFSEFSHRSGRSKSSAYRAEYASSIQNFQL